MKASTEETFFYVATSLPLHNPGYRLTEKIQTLEIEAQHNVPQTLIRFQKGSKDGTGSCVIDQNIYNVCSTGHFVKDFQRLPSNRLLFNLYAAWLTAVLGPNNLTDRVIILGCRQLLTFARGGAPVKKVASQWEAIIESVDFAVCGSNTKCSFHIAGRLQPDEVDEGQIGDSTLADAICDHLFHNAYKIELRGDFMRRNRDGRIATPAENQKNGKGGKLADATGLS